VPTKFVATEYDVEGLQHRLRADARLRHLRVRKHGSTMILESGPTEDPIPRVRLRKDGVHLWILEARGRSRWEPTGFRAGIETLLDTLVEALPWVIAPLPGAITRYELSRRGTSRCDDLRESFVQSPAGARRPLAGVANKP
jgi:hypothetical protein